jgi:hypothetical protein
MLSTTVNATNSAQNCQNMPKSIQRWNFEMPPKIEIWVFSKIKNCTYRRGTRACFYSLHFQSKDFSYAIFIVKKRPLSLNFSMRPRLVEIDDFLKVPHLVWAWDFVDMYLTHLEIRIQRSAFHIYLRKWFFWTPKDWCPLGVGAKKAFSSTLNVMISQMVRNESVRFGRHIDIEVSYKILQLEVPKLVPILHYLTCFQKGLFGCSFEQKHPSFFRG